MKTNIKKILLSTLVLTSVTAFADIQRLNLDKLNTNNTIQRESLAINSFKIKGLKNVDLYSMINIDIKKGDEFVPEKIEKLMGQIILTGYFTNVVPKISTNTANKSVDIVLEVSENPVIKSVKIKGITVLDVEKLKKEIGLVPNSVYNHYYLDQQKTPILKALVDAGLLAPALIDAKMENGNLEIVVSEGKVTRIEYVKKGTKEDNVRLDSTDFKTKTQDFVLKRNETFKVGDYLTIKGIQTTAQNLFRTGLFDSIEPKFEFEPNNPEGRVVIFEVEERSTASVNGQVSYSKETGIVGEVSLADKNFLGGQQEGSVAASFGTTGSYNFSLNYWNPYIQNTDRLQAGGSVYFSRNKLNKKDSTKRETIKVGNENKYLSGQFAELIRAYDTKTVGLSGTIGKGLTRNVYASVKPSISYSTSKTKGNIRLSSFAQTGAAFSLNYDTRDDIYLPKNGLNVTFTVEGNYIFVDKSLTRKTLKEAKSFLYTEQKKVTDQFKGHEEENYKDYKAKKEKFEKANPGKQFDPEKEGLDYTDAAKAKLKKAAEESKTEFENKVNDLDSKDKAKRRVYSKGDLEVLAFVPLVKDVNSLAFRTHIGIASKNSPESTLYVTDNYGKALRGFTDVETTNFIISSSLENRFYINKYLQVVAFADAGIYAHKTGGLTPGGYDEYTGLTTTLAKFKDNVKLSAGAGVRVNTPVGVLRLDYGLPLVNKPKGQGFGKLSFGFGHTF